MINSGPSIKQISSARVPTRWGEFRCYVYETLDDGIEHVAFVSRELDLKSDVLVRVHSECLTGDVFKSTKCDCGAQLDHAMKLIALDGGILIYLRGHEGRGIGLGYKINAYSLQEEGLDTVDANIALGLPVDSREYGVAAQILKDFDIASIRIITNNPAKITGLKGHGLIINERIVSPVKPTNENIAYLRTKKDKLGHLIQEIESSLE